MRNLIGQMHQSKFFGAIFHTLNFCLQRELSDCESVLDLGCGPSSPLKNCRNVKYSVGVEAFSPYVERSKKEKIHTEYVEEKIEEVEFPDNSFDAVIMIEVLEHLPEKTALEILQKASKWARKKIIISSPNGFVSQKEVDANPWQKHLSGWDYRRMKRMKFRSYGQSGLKFLRQEAQTETMGDDLMASIRFWPRPFWFFVAALSQIITYHLPVCAFGLFNVKRIKK